MKPALVIGCHIMGLGVIRALHLKGIPTVALHYESTDMAHLSRYPAERERIPHPGAEEEAFVDFFERRAERWPGALLIPCNDLSAVVLSRHRDRLARHYAVGVPPWESIEWFINKKRTYALADRCGIPRPATLQVGASFDVADLAGRIDYPCYLKPERGDVFKGLFKVKGYRVDGPEACAERMARCREAGQAMMIQEIIPGPDDQIRKIQAYANAAGELVGCFFLRKLRSNPPPFGVGRVNLSCGRDPEVEDLANRLVKGAGFRGGAISVEFKRDPRDGRLKLIENNIRFTRNGWLSTFCGINLPWLMYEDLVGQRSPEVTAYREGVYWIDLCPDMYHSLFHARREPDTLRDYLRPYMTRRKTFAVASLRDPLPFLKQALRIREFLTAGY